MRQQVRTYTLINQFIDSLCCPSWSIWNMQDRRIVVAHLHPRNFFLRFEIALALPLAVHHATRVPSRRTASQCPARLEVRRPSIGVRETLKNEKASEAVNSVDGALENLTSQHISKVVRRRDQSEQTYGRVNIAPPQIGNIDFKPSRGVFRKANFIGR